MAAPAGRVLAEKPKKCYHNIINDVMITNVENIMIRTQIQLTPEQARGLKKLALKKKKSISELIRLSVENMIHTNEIYDQDELRRSAIAAAGQLKGPVDLSTKHDDYLSEAFTE
jgi:hypothetical protein